MRRIAILFTALVIAGCGGGAAKAPPPPAKKLTGRQQDSVDRQRHHDLGESGIPMTSAVTKAQKAADRESKRVNALDTIH